jgi:hypothetical protein
LADSMYSGVAGGLGTWDLQWELPTATANCYFLLTTDN